MAPDPDDPTNDPDETAVPDADPAGDPDDAASPGDGPDAEEDVDGGVHVANGVYVDEDVAPLLPYHPDEVEAGSERPPLEQLIGPPAATSILLALARMEDRGETPATVSQIVERAPNAGRDVFYDHRERFLESGVVKEAGKVAGARTYRFNEDHPIAEWLRVGVRLSEVEFREQGADAAFGGGLSNLPEGETDEERLEELRQVARMKAESAEGRRRLLEELNEQGETDEV